LLSRVILTDGSKLFGDDWGAIRLDDIEVITVEDGSQVYEVAKTTVQIEHCTSAELQYVTERTRLSARAGLAAHLLYKLQKSPNGDGTMATVTDKDIAALSEIHKRRKELGSRELVNGSKEAAGQFMKRVSRSGGRRIVDWRWLIPTKKLNK
jgi:hypothetical protein